MPAKQKKTPKERKNETFQRIHDFLMKYKNILVCQIKDLPADLIHKIRKLLRGVDSEAICGKRTVLAKAIKEFAEHESKLPPTLSKDNLIKIADSLKGVQVMIIFTQNDLAEITKITNQFTIEKQAKPGQLSPI